MDSVGAFPLFQDLALLLSTPSTSEAERPDESTIDHVLACRGPLFVVASGNEVGDGLLLDPTVERQRVL